MQRGKMNNKLITDKNVNFNQAKLIETNQQKRAKSCAENIDRILEQHKCIMVPVVQIVGNTIKSTISIQSK